MILPINKLEKDSTNPKKRKYFMGRHLIGRKRFRNLCIFRAAMKILHSL